MKTDRELLESAAKAARIVAIYWDDGDVQHSRGPGVIYGDYWIWNPINDDGDALRLAVKLNLLTKYTFLEALGEENDNPAQDYYAATRRAIVRAAAAIGDSM